MARPRRKAHRGCAPTDENAARRNAEGREPTDFPICATSKATGWSFENSALPQFAGKLRPGRGGSLQLLLQRLDEQDPEQRTRAHLDPGSDDVEAEVARLVFLGAERLATGSGWVVMRDPSGLVFCVTANDPG